METLTQLARHLPVVLIVVGLLLVLIVLYVIFLLVRSSPQLRPAEAAAPPPGDPAADPAPAGNPGATPGAAPTAFHALGRSIDLRRSFRRAMRSLRRQVGGGDAVYRLPFYLVVGTAGAGDSELWHSPDLNLPFGPPLDESQRPDRCNFWIYDHGVVADLGGDYVLGHDGTADQKGFRLVLSLLQKYRPARPLDGVIVPVAAAELLASRDLEGFSALEQRADTVYRALWQVQKQLGMLFPIYVVVTGGDAVAGLPELAASLPEALRGEMLGWSNPYHLSQVYRSEWVEEAFGALTRDLRAVQKEAFAQGLPPAMAEKLLLLPSAAAQLEEPLRRYLDRLFKATAYHEPLQLRGLYLCARDRARQRSLFLRDLLERKIFAELSLAKPAPRALLARQRILRTLQWSAAAFFVLLALGTARSYLLLSREKGALESFFAESLRNLRDLRRQQTSGEPVERSVAQRWARRVLEGAAPIHLHRFGSLFIPHSWTGELQSDVDRSFDRVFDQLLFAAMKDAYEDRARGLTLEALSAEPPARLADPRFFDWEDREAVSIETSRELSELRTYLGELSQLERHTDLFNDLKLKGSPADLAKLAADPDDSLGLDLGEVPFADPQLIDHLLEQQRHRVDLAAVATGAPARTRALTQALVEFTESNRLAAALESVAWDIDHLGEADFGPSRTAAYQQVLGRLRWLRTELTKPGHEWIFRQGFHLGATFDDALAAAQASSLVGASGAQEISSTVEGAWITLRRRLAEIGSRFTGPILQVENGEPRMALSGDVQLLELALEGFLGAEFMGDGAELEMRPFAPGQRILWDLAQLEGAVGLYEPYQRFRERGLSAFPADLRLTLDGLARETLGDRIAAKVAQAQSFYSEVSPSHASLYEQELRAATQNLAAAAPLLDKVQSTYGNLDQWRRQQALQMVVAQQSGALLRDLDEMVEREQPYHLRSSDFSWWKGDAPIGFAPFEKADQTETALYLDSQRRRLQQLSVDIAQPLSGLLSKTGFHQQPEYRGLFDRWEGIAGGLQAYEAKKPGGSLESLEKFLLNELPQTSLESCAKAQRPPMRASDFFATRQGEIQRALYLRCGDLRGELAASHWRRFADFFNQRLAGRYPFAPSSAAATTAALADDVRTFFRYFDESLPLLRATRDDQGPLLPIAPDVAAFLDQMEGVRAFFAPYLDGKVRSPEPFYDLDVEMRVNREHELCGERIIEWVLELGGVRLDQRSAGKTVRWQPGQPIELRLRWAKDAPALPAAGTARAGFYVDGNWAVWRFDDRWALLHLLEELRAEPQDFPALEDPAPHTLRLTAALEKLPPADGAPPPAAAGVTDPGCQDDAVETRAFVRLRVLAPEDKTLLVRKPFPISAPRLVELSPFDLQSRIAG